MTGSGDNVATPAARAVFEGREFSFTRRDFRQIADMLDKDAGISLEEIKAPLVYSRLVRRLRELGIETFTKYCDLVQSRAGAEERRKMIAALTTNVTRFFREPHHFEHLKSRVLPDVIENVRRGGRLRIWSAGCSTGEEPYSIALTVLSVMRDAPRFDVKILAIDINKDVLDFASEGVYHEEALRPVSGAQRAAWFVPAGTQEGQNAWRAGDELRALVSFRELNLMADWPMKHAYHAIFCRNVTIYFDDRVRGQMWNRLAALLAPRGCLYVGHSERVGNATGLFQLEGNTTYRLQDRQRP